MLLRLSAGEVPLVDVLNSTAVLILGIFLAVKGASRLFRTALVDVWQTSPAEGGLSMAEGSLIQAGAQPQVR